MIRGPECSRTRSVQLIRNLEPALDATIDVDSISFSMGDRAGILWRPSAASGMNNWRK